MGRKTGKTLVVGAGISGIRAALDLAELGYGVTLIDRSAHIGGILSQLDSQFPNDRCGMCRMLPLVNRDAGSQYCLRKGLFHENIDILLSTELAAVEGEPGHFEVTLKEHPKWVDPDRCIGCGECTSVCPVEVPDGFNAGLARRKAVYLPVPHAIPNPYVIDHASCSRCGECERICPTHAIQIPERRRRGFRILVVDDELIVRDSLKEWLSEVGFSVDMAASGPEAIERLAQAPYQLMLLDIKMPGMDGVEVLQKAKEHAPDLGVIMMTAYATVETAVEAMKIGALDYLVKPFDVETLIPMVERRYEDLAAVEGRRMEVGAIVLCGGTEFFDPAGGRNPFGYGLYPNVVTSLEFERMLSGTGPFRGRPSRPADGQPVRKIAWIQCVGSRDLQADADFCSNICCMAAIKEALLAKEKIRPDLETTIFYMDMRAFGKSFQRYRDQAETLHGVRFKRARVHSITVDSESGDLILRSVETSGKTAAETFDLVVLSVGQRPAAGFSELAELLGVALNPWGFGNSRPISSTRTDRDGVLLGGSSGGLKDIGESVIQASAAASAASCLMHSKGGALALKPPPVSAARDTGRELPRIMVFVCACNGMLTECVDMEALGAQLKRDPAVTEIELIEQGCTAGGWEAIEKRISDHHPNRVLLGACMPYVYRRRFKDLARRTGVDPSLMEAVDIYSPWEAFNTHPAGKSSPGLGRRVLQALEVGVAKLRWADPLAPAGRPVVQQALVVGGGIAGMTAALTIAENGFKVDLVENADKLGGNLHWITRTLEGHPVQELLQQTSAAVEKHPQIKVHTRTQLVHAGGEVGQFETILEGPDNAALTLTHGAVILATGGREAATDAYGYGRTAAVVTQKELEQRLAAKSIDPARLNTVVMIQCVGSREEPRNYCSRVCCSSALKHALALTAQNPDLQIYVLYRDMMSYGFAETYYTRAREAGVVFIQYESSEKPQVALSGEQVTISVREPLIDRLLQIEADLLVLATGIVPDLPPQLAAAFGAAVDQDGFFQQADAKWRPVDALKEGVFACGLAHSPRNISETIATAEAAAQRALRILANERLESSKVTARVRQTICSLCERCVDACPYGARTVDRDRGQLIVNPAMCQGCGACAAACPNGAAVLDGFKEQQMLEVIDAAIG